MEWWESPLIIKGRSSGIRHITAAYAGETYNLVDFLNNSLFCEYSEAYDDILAKYEDLLNTESIFEFDYPEIAEKYLPINQLIYEYGGYDDDVSLVEALLKEYEDKLKTIHKHISQWNKELEGWFHGIKNAPEIGKLDIFKDIL
jgi:hypothetical protein